MRRLDKLSEAEWHSKIHKDRNNEKKIFTWDKVTQYREYTEGVQKDVLTDSMRDILDGLDCEEFSDNICNQIVAEARDRVRFLGWLCKDENVRKWLNEFFKTSRIRRLSSELHYDAFRDGNRAVHISFNKAAQRIDLFNESWFDGSVGTFINYDKAGHMEYVVKDWCEDEEKQIYRRNIYYPGKILRFRSENGLDVNGVGEGIWEPYRLILENGEEETWPVEYTGNGKILGIPYVHFLNTGWGLKSQYGRSELSGGIIGYQDQLNTLSWDMIISARLTACQIHTAVGVDPKSEFKVGAGEIWKVESENAQFGVLPPGNQDSLIKIYNLKGRRVAQISRTPAHIITGAEWPSGEALVRAETPAIGKADSQIDGLNDVYILLAHRAIEIWNAFSDSSVKLKEDPKKAMLMTRFAATDRQDALSQSVVVNNLGDRISPEEALRRMHYEDDDIEKILAEIDARKDKEIERERQEAKFQSELIVDQANKMPQPISSSENGGGAVGSKPKGGRRE
jgi:hypothetical protein